MLQQLIATLEPEDFTFTAFSVAGNLFGIVILAVIAFLLFRCMFSKVIALICGPRFRAFRIVAAAAIYVPLIGWWIERVLSRKTDFLQWLAMFALLTALNYVPVNILGHVITAIAECRTETEIRSRTEE